MRSAIQQAREQAGLRISEVAAALHCSGTLLYQIENGRRVSAEDERVILRAIERLARFKETVATARQTLCADLKLAPLQPTRGRPIPFGKSAWRQASSSR